MPCTSWCAPTPTAPPCATIFAAAPADRILIETDAPYLTPQPRRGTRNEPAFVAHTAEFLGDFYDIGTEELALRTTDNFFRFFNLNKGNN